MKNFIIRYILLFLLLAMSVDFAMAQLSYTGSTPADGSYQITRSFNTEISIIEPNLKKFGYSFGGIEYPIYDSGVLLMMNFDNKSTLGETTSLVKDLSIYNNTGTIYNGATWTGNGKYNGAYSFDGVDDHIVVPNNTQINKAYNYTISYWINKHANSTAPLATFSVIIDKYMTAGFLFKTLNNNEICLDGRNGSSDGYRSLCGYFIDLDKWYFISMSFEQLSWKLYVNGILHGSINRTNGNGLSNGNNLYIGKFWDNGTVSTYAFNGMIDEVRYYNKVLSSGEIQQFYNSNLSKYDTDKRYFRSLHTGLLDGLYTFNACSTNILNYTDCLLSRIVNIGEIDNTHQGQLSLEILSGTSQCIYGTSLSLGNQDVKFDTGYTFTGDFGTGERSCTDYKAGSGSRTFTIQSSDLTNGKGNSISATGIEINHSEGTRTGDPKCMAGYASGSTWAVINTPYTIMERKIEGQQTCKVAIPTVNLKIGVGANQAPGTYSGTLTLTLQGI